MQSPPAWTYFVTNAMSPAVKASKMSTEPPKFPASPPPSPAPSAKDGRPANTRRLLPSLLLFLLPLPLPLPLPSSPRRPRDGEMWAFKPQLPAVAAGDRLDAVLRAMAAGKRNAKHDEEELPSRTAATTAFMRERNLSVLWQGLWPS